MSDAQAAADPNGPVMPGAWKPICSGVCSVAAPSRNITSTPAMIAAMSSLPLAFTACAIASAGSATVAPACTPAPGLRRLSYSKACAKAPATSAACGTCSVLPETPGTRHGPPAPVPSGSASTIADQGNRAHNAAPPHRPHRALLAPPPRDPWKVVDPGRDRIGGEPLGGEIAG